MQTQNVSQPLLTQAIPNTSVPPPLPNQSTESKPPLPPEEPTLVKDLLNYTAAPPNQSNNYNTMPPKEISSKPQGIWGKPNQNWKTQDNQWNKTNPSSVKNFNLSAKQNYNLAKEFVSNRVSPPDTQETKKGRFESSVEMWQNNQKSSWKANESSKPAVVNKKLANVKEELSEAEKKFIRQFAEWESQFVKWKEQNQHHPDKEQYREYEKKWEAWRTQLLERREQMRKKRLGMASANEGVSPKVSLQEPSIIPNLPQHSDSQLVNISKPPPNIVPEQVIDEIPPKLVGDLKTMEKDSGFLLTSNTSGGIPGLDLVKDGKDNENNENEKVSEPPDMEALSKGINNILSDEKLMSMLSMVSQNQIITNLNPADTTSNTEMNPPIANSNDSFKFGNEASNVIADDQSNQENHIQRIENFSNMDEQTRTSFGGQYEHDYKCISDSRGGDNYDKRDFNKTHGNNFNKNYFRSPELLRENPPKNIIEFGNENFNRRQRSFNNQEDSYKSNIAASGEENYVLDFDNFNRSSSISKGVNDFNRTSDNFNRGPDNFDKPQEGFVQDSDKLDQSQKFNRDPDNFDRRSGNFNRDSDCFNQGSDSFVRDKFNRTDNFSRGPGNFNRTPDNFNRNFNDFSRHPDNFSRQSETFNKGFITFNKTSENFNRNSDTFNRDFNNFNRRSDNLNRNCNNFSKDIDNFKRRSDGSFNDFNRNRDCNNDFKKDFDTFVRGSESIKVANEFSKEYDNFERGLENFNKRPKFNRESDNFRKENAEDFGSIPSNLENRSQSDNIIAATDTFIEASDNLNTTSNFNLFSDNMCANSDLFKRSDVIKDHESDENLNKSSKNITNRFGDQFEKKSGLLNRSAGSFNKPMESYNFPSEYKDDNKRFPSDMQRNDKFRKYSDYDALYSENRDRSDFNSRYFDKNRPDVDSRYPEGQYSIQANYRFGNYTKNSEEISRFGVRRLPNVGVQKSLSNENSRSSEQTNVVDKIWKPNVVVNYDHKSPKTGIFC